MSQVSINNNIHKTSRPHTVIYTMVEEGRKLEGNCCSATGLLHGFMKFISKNVLFFYNK